MTESKPLAGTRTFNGVSIERTSLDEAVSVFVRAVAGDAPAQTHRLVNAYTIALADSDPAYQRLLERSGVNLPDGKPLVVALNLLYRGGERYSQVRGPSFFLKCLDQGRGQRVRHFFLGGSPELLESLKGAVDRRFPGTQIVGMASPPFRALTNNERTDQDSEIKASGAQVVWVALGTPKQDFEAQRICDECAVTTAAVGAAFDFAAGTKRQAPEWMRRMSLEWVFRLISEPRRLWKRYLFGNAHFIAIVLREAVHRR